MLELPPSSRLPLRVTLSNMNTNTLGTKWFSNTGDILASLLLVTTLLFYPTRKICCFLMPDAFISIFGINDVMNIALNLNFLKVSCLHSA